MPSLLEILNDPNYTGANAATKQAIFDRYSAQDENYTGANDPTKQAIRERFGLVQPQAAPAQPAPRPEDQSIFRQVADVPLNLTQGAVSGVRMIADVAGANTAVSQNLRGVESFLGDLMSAQAKNDKTEISRIMKAAEDKGVYEQVKAGVKALSIAPVDTLVNAFGTSAPAIAATLATVVAGAPTAVVTGLGLGIGSLMGAGTVKGSIYQDTKQALIEAGVDPKQADARAELAQQYNGKNLDSILMGTALGGLANVTGMQPAIAKALAGKILSKAATTEATKDAAVETVKRSYTTIAKDLTKAGLTEGTPEFLQAFQEQVASNVAQQREGLDVPTFRGAVAQGTLEGLAGLGLGTGVKAVGMRAEAKKEQLVEDTKAVTGVDPTPSNKDALVKQYITYGIPREEAEMMADRIIAENAKAAEQAVTPETTIEQATTPGAVTTEAATQIPAGVDPQRLEEIEIEYVNAGYSIKEAKAKALEQAIQEVKDFAEDEATSGQEKANANISTVPTSTGTGTTDVGAGTATDIQQQLGQSAGQVAGAQPDGMASAGASAAQPAAGKVGEPSPLGQQGTPPRIDELTTPQLDQIIKDAENAPGKAYTLGQKFNDLVLGTSSVETHNVKVTRHPSGAIVVNAPTIDTESGVAVIDPNTAVGMSDEDAIKRVIKHAPYSELVDETTITPTAPPVAPPVVVPKAPAKEIKASINAATQILKQNKLPYSLDLLGQFTDTDTGLVSKEAVLAYVQQQTPVATDKKTLSQEAISEKLNDFYLDPEGKKSSVIAFAKKLVAQGILPQEELDSLTRMSKDRDIDKDEVIRELETSLEIINNATPDGLPTIRPESSIQTEYEKALRDLSIKLEAARTYFRELSLRKSNPDKAQKAAKELINTIINKWEARARREPRDTYGEFEIESIVQQMRNNPGEWDGLLKDIRTIDGQEITNGTYDAYYKRNKPDKEDINAAASDVQGRQAEYDELLNESKKEREVTSKLLKGEFIDAINQKVALGTINQTDSRFYLGIASGNTRQALNAVLNRNATDGISKIHKLVAKLLLAANIAPKIEFYNPIDPTHGGVYQHYSDLVRIDAGRYIQGTSFGDSSFSAYPSTTELINTFLHELIHASTVSSLSKAYPLLTYLRQGGTESTLTQEEKNYARSQEYLAAKNIIEVFDWLVTNHGDKFTNLRTDKNYTYGATNPFELVAEVFLDDKLHDVLANITLPENLAPRGQSPNAWDWFLSAIRKLINIKGVPNNALDQIMRSATEAMRRRKDSISPNVTEYLTDKEMQGYIDASKTYEARTDINEPSTSGGVPNVNMEEGTSVDKLGRLLERVESLVPALEAIGFTDENKINDVHNDIRIIAPNIKKILYTLRNNELAIANGTFSPEVAMKVKAQIEKSVLLWGGKLEALQERANKILGVEGQTKEIKASGELPSVKPPAPPPPPTSPQGGAQPAPRKRKKAAPKKTGADKILERIDKSTLANETVGLIGELARAKSFDDVIGILKAGFGTLNSKKIQALLPALTTSQIIDWVGSKIPRLVDANRMVERMDTMRMKMLSAMSDIVTPWFDYSKEYTSGSEVLSRTMHYTTLTGVDPTLFPNLAAALTGDTTLVQLNKDLAAAIDLKSKIKIKGEITKRTNLLPTAYELWDQLGSIGKGEGRAIYAKVKDHYKAMFDLHRVLLDRLIVNSTIPGNENDASTPKGKLMAAIRKSYADALKSGVYFPLMRYGNYWVSVGKGVGREFYMFESEFKRDQFVREKVEERQKAGDARKKEKMQEDGDLDYGNDLTKLRNKATESSEMLRGIFEMVDKNKGANTTTVDADKLKDAIYQMYLTTLPEKDFRKQWIHRKGTAGFSGDVLRNFVRAGFSNSGHLSKLRYGHDITLAVDAAHDSLKGNPDKPLLEQFVNEIGVRTGLELNPDVEEGLFSKFANGVNQAAFVMYLTGAKSAVANMTAIPIFGYPVLASRYGMGKSATKLASYMNIFNHTTVVTSKPNGDLQWPSISVGMSKHVQGNRVLAAAFADAAERGITEITRTYDLLQMSRLPSDALSHPAVKFKRAAVNMMGSMFHASERMNREIMYMASFELAYEKAVGEGKVAGINGEAYNIAVDAAVKNTYDSMFNYSRFNRPRVFRPAYARVALQFKMFPQQVTVYLVKNFYSMLPFIKGNDNKKEAATQLFGTLAMTGLFAGAAGMPLYSVIMGVLQGLRSALQDDDEPIPIEERDLDLWFRNVFLPQMLGVRGAEIAYRGLASEAGGDIASSTSLNNMWFREVKNSPSLTAEFRDSFFALLGPGFALGESVFKAGDDFKNGYISQGLEKLTPAMFRGMITATRWNEEGVKTKGLGASIYDEEEVTRAMLAWKVLGFTPTDLSRIQAENFKHQDEITKINQTKQKILNRINLDIDRGDDAHLEKEFEKFSKFLRDYPSVKFDADTILNSVQRRAELRAMANRGLSIPEELQGEIYPLLSEGR